MKNLYDRIEEGDGLNRTETAILTQLALKEELGCRIKGKSQFYVHFGYDYYMYIGSVKPCDHAIHEIRKSGLFIEEYESPYQEDDE
ncbi:hypothetical protein NNL21_15410 [Paenibacillus mendelii]|nr:hypothetical protein [Paenibacillus mendelii]